MGRALHDDSWEIGKLNAWARFGTPYHGREYETAQGEVLVATGNHVSVYTAQLLVLTGSHTH